MRIPFTRAHLLSTSMTRWFASVDSMGHVKIDENRQLNSRHAIGTAELEAFCESFDAPVICLGVTAGSPDATLRALSIIATSGMRVSDEVAVNDESLSMSGRRVALGLISSFTDPGARVLIVTPVQRDAIDLRAECQRYGFQPCVDWMGLGTAASGRKPPRGRGQPPDAKRSRPA